MGASGSDWLNGDHEDADGKNHPGPRYDAGKVHGHFGGGGHGAGVHNRVT